MIGAEATAAERSPAGKPLITHRQNHVEVQVEADLLVFVAGVNAVPGMRAEDNPMFQFVQRLLPGFKPPRLLRGWIRYAPPSPDTKRLEQRFEDEDKANEDGGPETIH